MLVETDAGRKGEVGAEANEHSAPVSIVDVEVVLHDPALGQLQMPAVVPWLANGGQDAGRLSCLEDEDQLVRLSSAEVRFDKLIASALGSFQDGDIPLLGSVLHPAVKLLGDFTQQISANGILIAVGAEKADHPLGLLERLDQAIEQNAVKAAIAEANVILVVLVESVHGELLCGQIPGA